MTRPPKRAKSDPKPKAARRPSRKAAEPSPQQSKEEPEAAAEAPPLRVEIESVLVGWAARSRFDVLLRGQIFSGTPAASFSIRDPAGVEVASVQFGLDAESATASLPGGGTGYQTGFQVYLPLPGGDEVRIADMWVRAEDQEGTVFEEAMRIGCVEDKAAILAGPAHDLSSVVLPVPPGIVYLESAEIGADGVLRAEGWTLSTSPIVAVQFFAGGERVGAAAHGRERWDVRDAYPDYPNAHHAGFVLERQAEYPQYDATTLTVQVLCLSGACYAATIPLTISPDARIPHPPDPVPVEAIEEIIPAEEPAAGAWDIGRAILLICDQAILVSPDVLLVEGWSACGHGIERIMIEVDGRPEGEADYGRERLDVAAEYPGMPTGTGYEFEKLIPGLSGGPHEVRIIAVSRLGDEKDIATPLVDPSTPAFRFELDVPATRDGIAVEPITGRMAIEGWALARDGMAGIDVALDGAALGPVHYGVVRPDVGAAFPAWTGAARSGYTFHCPARALPDGEHVVALTARSKTGETHVHSFRIVVRKTEDPEESASIRRKVSRVERDTVFAVLDRLDWRPDFHLIATANEAVDDKACLLTIRSILEQSWPNWRVTILAVDEPQAEAIRALLGRAAHEDAERFRVIDPSDAAAWHAPLAGDGAALTAILALGDELGRDALGAFAMASGLHPEAECLYADEFRLAPGTARPEAFFKPDFSPTLLLSTNYIGRPLVVRSAVLPAAGVTMSALMRDGAYDLTLRCTEAAAAVHHVRELLSRTDGGEAGDRDDGAAALARAMERRGIAAELLPGAAPHTWRVRRTTPVTGKVSIIIPTCAAKGHVETCLKTLREMTAYRNFEIICIDNIPESEANWKAFVREHSDKIVDMPPPFNWSRFNNRAVDVADGEYLLFLNDDIEIIEPGWLDTMLEDAARPEVGIVGARLLYPNRTVQHAGMFLGANGIGRHAFRYADEAEPGYFGLALTRREVIAVTGACLLVRRRTFDRLGRFDEAHEVVNNDLDFCLRSHRAGLLTIYTPHATLIHHELASRENMRDDFDTTRFTGAWRTLFAAGDPYFNPHLSRNTDDLQVEDEGLRAAFAGHPLIHHDEVKRILVVKLDHIGDFITSLPAIRRLKTSFPGSRLTVLAAPASTAFAAAEPMIDEFIPFEFFHARSELGEKELTRDDLDALTEQLAPYRFDIAVDMRKHLSTRHILRCSGARILAGYDSLDRFPWLDVALEWEGDKALQHKRNHITDDLVNLAAAIEAACEPNRKLIDPRPAPMQVDELPERARGLFAHPVVIVHPGAGNITKQWPEAHVTGLIDLLIERNDVSVLLIGGKDEAEIAEAIVEHVARPDRIASVVGDVSLRDLPRLLVACTLFIGNDSGPKHIAAAVGVPTIGIHSGVVDPGEWSPMGEQSVALHRNMNCSPCYLSKADDCPRGLACIQLLEPTLVHQMAERFLARPVAVVKRAEPETAKPPAAMPEPAMPEPAKPPGKRTRRMSNADVKKDEPEPVVPPPAKPLRKRARRPQVAAAK